MKKWLCAAALFIANALSASLHLEPGGWGIQGEFLYLHPSFDDLFFAIGIPESLFPPTNVLGQRKNNEFNYKPGFRLEGAYASCCPGEEIHVRWTHLDAKEDATATGRPGILPTSGHPIITPFGLGSISSHVDFHFNSVEGFFQKDVYLCCPLALSLRLGVEYARLSAHESLAYRFLNGILTAPEGVTYHQKMWGIGPEFGLAGDYWLGSWCQANFSLAFQLSATLMASRLESCFTHRQFFPSGRIINTQNDPFWKVVPGGYARVGLNYERCFNWFCDGGIVSLEVGYEFTTYRDAIAKIRYLDEFAAGTSLNHYSNFDMHGPYVALALNF